MKRYSMSIGLNCAMGEKNQGFTVDASDLPYPPLYRQAPFAVFLIPPHDFNLFAVAIGRSRAISYRVLSPATLDDIDLDGRDLNYWHLLVIDEQAQNLAGGARISFSKLHDPSWCGDNSYLEHCYPRLDQHLRSQNDGYVELGRTFVSPDYQRKSNTLLHIMRATVMLAADTHHRFIIGMVSYNHFQFSPAANALFLTELLTPAFKGDLVVPPPRHACVTEACRSVLAPMTAVETTAAAISGSQAHTMQVHSDEAGGHDGADPPATQIYADLERKLRTQIQDDFRIPIIMKRYVRMAGAKPIGLSIAKDFNQITEILMYCDVSAMSPLQRRKLLHHDRDLSWFNHLHSPHNPSVQP